MLNLEKNAKSSKVVTRFAPSPTGLLHCGGIRTALYNYLFAKQNGGIFYLRVEDTDQKRFVKDAEDYIKDSLEWVGINPDFAPWKTGDGHFKKMRQSERDYKHHYQYLIDNGYAYYAFDTESELNSARKDNPNFAYDAKTRLNMRNSLSLSKDEVYNLLKNNSPYVIRFKVPENKEINFTDMIRGDIKFNSSQIDDKVLVKSNGIPTYHLANVTDDHDMGTTHVIRGEEWLPSCPLHVMLYESFGWKTPEFAHLPSILKPDGKGKLSKRDGVKLGIPVFPFGGDGVDDKGNVVKYKGFKDEGFEPDAVLNFLLMLGWAPTDTREMFSIDDMINHFSLDRVHKAGAKFNFDKSKWFNSEYVRSKSDKELLSHLHINKDLSSDRISMILDICKKRSIFVKDMQSIADIFLKDISLSEKDIKSISDDYKNVFNQFLTKEISDWSMDVIKNTISDICLEIGIKIGKVMPSLRIALTGGLPGPDLMSVMYILGKEETNNRIKKSL